ncbi:MAG TPA: hypothetical protein VEW05_01725 [Candidatus Polarisedimenticolia bacterium]|nr:hypothetical protein [Candidatus Polarisedimenticolia bacterium]
MPGSNHDGGLIVVFGAALWKDADRDIPILLSAKAEYAKLK